MFPHLQCGILYLMDGKLLQKRIFIGVILLSFLSSGLPLLSLDSRFRVELIPGFGGAFETGTWVPINLLIETPSISGSGIVSLSIPYGSIYSQDRDLYLVQREISFTGKGFQRMQFLIPIKRSDRVLVTVHKEGELLFQKEVSLFPINPGSRKILILSKNPSLDFIQNLVPASGESFSSLYTHPEYLPENAAGYSGVDALVIHNLSLTGVSQAQFLAIRDWIRAGGNLIICGGIHLRRDLPANLEALNPVSILGYGNITSLKNLEDYTGIPLPDQEYYSLSLAKEKRNSEVLLEQDGLPLIVKQNLERGVLMFCALDYSAPPYRDWKGKEIVWEKLLSQLKERPPLASLEPLLLGMEKNFFETKGLEKESFLPSGLILILGSIIIILLLLILPRGKILSSLLLPVLSLLMAGYYFLYPRNSQDLFYLETSLARVNPSIPLTPLDLSGNLVSKRPVRAEIKFPATQSAIIPEEGTDFTITIAPGETLLAFNLKAWSRAGFSSRQYIELPLTKTISRDGEKFIVGLVNNSTHSFSQFFFVYRNNPLALPREVQRGKSASAAFRYNPHQPQNPGDGWDAVLEALPQEERFFIEHLREQEQGRYFSSSEHLYFLAWIEDPPDFIIPGTEQTHRRMMLLGEINLWD